MNLANEPAFPCQALGQSGLPSMELSPGMTTRTWLAGLAMQALIAANNLEQYQQGSEDTYLKSFEGSEEKFDGWIANRSREMADALLAVLERSIPPAP